MNIKSVNNLIPIAREIANAADYNKQFRHVSIITSGKSIVAIGENGHKTHTLAQELDYKYYVVHSELDAFSKIRYRNGNFVLINFRFNRAGELCNSRPCRYCMPWCVEFFDSIFYSNKIGEMVKLK